MKKYIAVIVFLFLLSAVSSAATLNKIMREETKDSLRLILDISGEAKYVVSKGNSYAVISIPNLMPLPAVPKRIKSKVLESVMIGENNGICGITAQFKYLTSLNVSTIKNPHVMIIEFRKLSKMKVPKINAPQIEMTVTPKSISTVSTAEIVVTSDEAAGLRYAKMSKDTEEGPVTVNALIADQKLLNVYPFLAHKKPGSPNFIGMVGSLFAFWGQEERTKYVKDKVSDMADETKAIAGVNGTFFGRAGEPLGILMINGELVSYSILDRTALIIDSSNRCYIDNVSLSGESQIEGRTIQISGINRKRGTGEAIVYTPKYGVQTDEDSPGIVLSVSNDEVKDICRAHARIPEDGYVLSLDPNYWDELGDKIHVGSRISTKMKLIPLSGLSNLEIKHVIGGGPRLLKSGEIYISKNSEQFKTDIAKSRAARTAVGINSDGSLVFATVDKCPESASHAKSAGVTLEELAVIMKNLGCVEAMNLDGGSSSTMVLYDNVVNVPSGGEEKPVSNGILIGK